MSVISQSIEPRPGDKNRVCVNPDNSTIDACLTVYAFEDNGSIVTYIPALNLSAYGKTQQESNDIIVDVVLTDFFDNLLELPLNRVTHEFSRLGWSAIEPKAGRFEYEAPAQIAFFNPSTYLKPIEPRSYCIHKQFVRLQVPL